MRLRLPAWPVQAWRGGATSRTRSPPGPKRYSGGFLLIHRPARSWLWCQIIADVLGVPLLKPAVEDAALGAAMLAGVAVGLFADWQHAVDQCAKVEAVFQPDARRHDLYSAYFQIYRAVTKDLQAHDLALTQLAAKASTRELTNPQE